MEKLHPDLVLEIRSRLPIESILECRKVCKIWRSAFEKPKIGMLSARITYRGDVDPYYKEQSAEMVYFNFSKEIDNFYTMICANTGDNGSFFSTLVGSCNGLVCYKVYETGIGYVMYIANPFTGECIRVPKTGPAFDQAGFGYCHSTNEYKVVKSLCIAKGKRCVQVYTLGGSGWRDKPEITYRFTKSGVFANGALHWISATSNSYDIVAFDLADETFRPLARPSILRQLPSDSYINVTPEGILYLCLPCIRDRIMDIWVFEKNNVNNCQDRTHFNTFTWVKVFSIRWDTVFNNCYLLSLTESEILLLQNGVLSCYERKATIPEKLWCSTEGAKGIVQPVPHMHSLVSLKDLGEELIDC